MLRLRFMACAAGAALFLAANLAHAQTTPPAPAAGEAEIGGFGFDMSGMDTSVRPGHDFNRFASGHYLTSNAIPADKTYGWRVEEEFISAIRGNEPIRRTSFADAVHYMDFSEAVHISSREGRRVYRPLD